jgi:hypothetical protein
MDLYIRNSDSLALRMLGDRDCVSQNLARNLEAGRIRGSRERTACRYAFSTDRVSS